MNFELREIKAIELQEFYDDFDGEKTFVQTDKFGKFREILGEKNIILGIFADKKLIGVAQTQKIMAKRGTFLHVPHGPLIFAEFLEEALPFFLKEIKKIGQTEKCDFVRVSSLLPAKNKIVFSREKFRDAPIHINPDRTWILDLTQSEADILKNMKKSNRYEINRIERSEIEIVRGNSRENLDIFWNLHLETVKRQGFTPFSRKTTEAEMKVFGDDCQIFSAKIKEEFLSSSIILFDNFAGYYHQGSSVYSKFPVAHATLWAGILEAKKRGCQEFNFWGVSPEENKKHPWTGLSNFKRRFGGEERKFLNAQDYPLTIKYWLNWLVETWRRKKKGY
jgi:lipid II:glycine glycyltransferase (peptidoglycan interpeptide bridge formation enzyme)